MIKFVVVVNNHGKPRLTKFYEYMPEDMQQRVIQTCFQLVTRRAEGQCNTIEATGPDGEYMRLVFRNYATLYFVFCVDEAESQLGILDLIQVFVETLDRCFENVCELDLIFHMDRVNYVLDEFIVGGLVAETSMREVLDALQAAKLEERAYSSSSAVAAFSSILPGSN
uniref:AP complex subunit sigma n=1 Tax=Erythrolobus madagascarensis TaxID=708628 RepID=A0A7S0T7P8_9RHOD|mmetsp:Transcript_2085/g.4626  ORF Transcript_2085/g.4626 Transcript_2085/m.4626 type:complete len:168 (+) Transcript_2085:126-629(+)